MSIKTAFKRVALVAAAALAIGGISAVSAQAATAAAGGTVTLSSSSSTVGLSQVATTNATFGFTSAAVTDTGTLTVALATKPGASALTSASLTLAGVSISTGDTRSIVSRVDTLTAAGYVALTHTSASATDSITFTPDAVGTYTITATNNVTGATVATWTVNAGTAPVVAAASSTPLTGTYSTVTLYTGHADKYYTIASTGVGSVLYPGSAPAGTGLVSGASELLYAGATPGAANFVGAATEKLVFSVYSASAGTQTLTVTGDSSSAVTTTLTWGAAPVVSAANSIVASNNATDVLTPTQLTVATEDTSLVSLSTSGLLAGGAYVLVNNNATPAAPVTTDTIAASVSGPGLLKVGSTEANAAAAVAGRSVSNAQGVGSTAVVLLYGDGTTGTATVTVSDSTAGIVLGTFSVVFYDSTIAKLVATVNTNVPAASVTGFAPTATEGINGSVSPTGGAPVSVIATDANGNKIPSAAGISVSSGTTSVATVGSVTYDSTNGYSYVNIIPASEGKTVLTFSDTATGLVTATATVLVTKAVASTVVASTDAASYDPGTKVVYTLTATDAAGNPIADGTYTGFFSTAPTSNVGLQGALPGLTPVTFSGGVNNSTVYSPVNSANVAIAGGTVIAGFLASATATATNEADFSTTGSSDVAANAATDAANEATDAANAATDAANAAADSADAATQAAQDAGDKADAALAAVTALSQQVTTLLAKVAALSATIAKIAKKLKA